MSRRAGSVRRRVPPPSSATPAEHTPVVVPDVAMLVRRHVAGPVLAWAAAPAAVWVGCGATGHVPSADLGAAIAACAAAGAALSLRRGARTVTALLVRDNAARAAGTAAAGEQRQQAHDFWQRASASLEGAVLVLRDSHGSLTEAHREAISLSSAQDRDFRDRKSVV